MGKKIDKIHRVYGKEVNYDNPKKITKWIYKNGYIQLANIFRIITNNK